MKHTTLWLLKRVRRRIPAIVLMTAAYMGQALLSVWFALGTRAVIDSAMAGAGDAFRSACIRQAVLIAALLLSSVVLRHLRDVLAMELERDWKRRLLHGLLHGDYASIERYHSAELLNRLNNDVARVNNGILSIVPSAAAMATRLVAAVVVLGSLDARFTLLVVLAGSALVIATGFMRRRLKDLNKRVSEHDGKVSGFLQEIMEKLLMVQAMDVSREVELRTEKLMEDRYALQRRRKNVSLLTGTGVSLMSVGGGFLALVWCAARILEGTMTVGAMTAIIQLVSQLQSPFVNISGIMPVYIAMTASAERLMELEAIRGEPEPITQSPHSLYARMDSIRGRGLTFRYDRDVVLEGADFEIPKGSFAVITGPSGIGKSTLLKLLLGIFTPEAGEMTLACGGEDVALSRAVRPLFAYVPQGNLLLSGSLRENLTIVRPDASQAEIDMALKVSCMDEVVAQLPKGLDTPMGESGAGLSEGQGQRLAIARAVLGGAPVLLLDECTSALDAETEGRVLENLRNLPNRTCIAVTHRPAAAGIATLRLHIDEGRISML